MIYKGFELDDQLSGVIRYMDNIERYRADLQRQQTAWDYLSVLGQLSKVDVELSYVRDEFSQLTGVLLNQLGMEMRNKTAIEYAFKAQTTIDIMIRNLFERTADIGFFATDMDVLAYLIALNTSADGQYLAEQRTKLHERFQEYVSKYSVYHNIILLDTLGNVLLQLDESNPVQHSKDALIQASLQTQNAYIESFGYSDLMPSEQNSLIYAYRVTDANQALGVVCLCFRFENECVGIFNKLLDQHNPAILTLMDSQGKVIASSNSDKIPLRTRLKVVLEDGGQVVSYNGEEYLAYSRATQGYQGYIGTGWFGHALVPLNKAFAQDMGNHSVLAGGGVLSEVLQSPTLFSLAIRSIPLRANQIQSELNRSVWNGNVQQAIDTRAVDAAVSKVLLSEIKNTGIHTKQIFEDSISDLQKTVISGVLQDAQSMASLAIDIMDRNLYERTNDCRWWALTTSFRQILTNKTLQTQDIASLQSTLVYINSLYTVYSNLLLFDRQGKVIAVSASTQQHLLSTTLDELWVKDALNLHSTQAYTVSDFVATSLYENMPSYIYAAAIRSLDNQQVLGGIGIVFDATPQFNAMLQDVLPRDAHGEIIPNNFALFTDTYKQIIATCNTQMVVGSFLDISTEFFDMGNAPDNGQYPSQIILLEQKYYAVGCCKSTGYREYHYADGANQSTGFAFIFIYLCEAHSSSVLDLKKISTARGLNQTFITQSNVVNLATFYVGGSWLALKSNEVESATVAKNVVPLHGGEPSALAAYMPYKNDSIALLQLSVLLGGTRPTHNSTFNIDDSSNVIIVFINGTRVGLIVDELGEIMDIAPHLIQPVDASLTAAHNSLVKKVVLPEINNINDFMLQLIDIDALSQQLKHLAM